MSSICVWVYARTEDMSFVSNARAAEYYSNANAEFPLLTGLACTPVYLAWLLPVQGRILLYSVHTQRNAYMQNHTLIYMHAQENWYFLRDPTHGHTHTHWESFWRAFEAAWLECAVSSGRLAGGLYGISAFRNPNMRGNNLLVLWILKDTASLCASLILSLWWRNVKRLRARCWSDLDQTEIISVCSTLFIEFIISQRILSLNDEHNGTVSNRVSAGTSWHFTKAPLLMHCFV